VDGIASAAQLRYAAAVDLRARRIGTVRAFGTMALLAGFVIALITLSADQNRLEPHFVAALLVLTGLSLRVEAAVMDRRP
jgi:hypothetical protein